MTHLRVEWLPEWLPTAEIGLIRTEQGLP